jgi:N-acetylneuraminic acid mutarotase
MIVWGGYNYTGLNDGGRYNPEANTWTAVPTTGAPAARYAHTAVWTGSEMIVWGGEDWNGARYTYHNDGGRYSLVADSWTAVPTNGAPGARTYHTAVWTGSEMIVWGGYYWDGSRDRYDNDGGRYNPTTDSWTALPTSGAPGARAYHTAVWTGSEMIVWGGGNGSGWLNDGGRYNPVANSWTAVRTNGAPARREWHTAVWTGSEMIVWGGVGYNGSYLNDGGRYNVAGNCWTAIPGTGAPGARRYHTAVWTSSEMILFGGRNNSGPLSDTWSYFPYAPAVRISRPSTTSAEVAWPVWSSKLRLCQTTNVAWGPWITVTNEATRVGSENRITVSPLNGRQFFRAEYP